MKKVFLALLVGLMFASVAFSQEGTGTGYSNETQLLRSMADWATMKALGDISTYGSVCTISVWYPSYLCKGFMNPRRDSSVYVQCITSMGDTVKLSIPTEGTLWKLPIIAKIITATSSDSTIALFQKR